MFARSYTMMGRHGKRRGMSCRDILNQFALDRDKLVQDGKMVQTDLANAVRKELHGLLRQMLEKGRSEGSP